MQDTEYSIIDVVYPVGSIYMSVNTSNPSTLFPNTTWEKIQGKFLLGSNSSHALGSTGGAETHTLTTAQMPTHTHTQNSHNHSSSDGYNFVEVNDNTDLGMSTLSAIQTTSSGTKVSVVYADTRGTITEKSTTVSATASNQNAGSGQAHNNMPPFLTVNIWKRIE